MAGLTGDQLWAEIYKQAGVKKDMYDVPTPQFGIRGRFISVLATRLAKFWVRHQDTLIPFLSQLAIAALEAVAQNLPAIQAVNPPGPE